MTMTPYHDRGQPHGCYDATYDKSACPNVGLGRVSVDMDKGGKAGDDSNKSRHTVRGDEGTAQPLD